MNKTLAAEFSINDLRDWQRGRNLRPRPSPESRLELALAPSRLAQYSHGRA